MNFHCLKCGSCCRHIATVEQLADFNNGYGICVHLLSDNLCAIYNDRPIWCNVERLYLEKYASILTEEEWSKANKTICGYLASLDEVIT